jgi:hypothetical protein
MTVAVANVNRQPLAVGWARSLQRGAPRGIILHREIEKHPRRNTSCCFIWSLTVAARAACWTGTRSDYLRGRKRALRIVQTDRREMYIRRRNDKYQTGIGLNPF